LASVALRNVTQRCEEPSAAIIIVKARLEAIEYSGDRDGLFVVGGA